MKTSEIFKAAKRHLRGPREENRSFAMGYSEYICVAIALARSPFERRNAAQVIMSRLECPENNAAYTAGCWLRDKHGIELCSDDMQRWRHMWLDQLIAEFEAKGD